MPSGPPSRPNPDCLTPPNGAAGLETMPWLRPIMPVSSASETRSARLRSEVNRYDARPYSVALAARMACSSVEKVTTGATGPKISSVSRRLPGWTSPRTVAS